MNENNLSLTYLACQLGSPHDRHRYTKVIVLSKQLQEQINGLRLSMKKQQYNNNSHEDEDDEGQEVEYQVADDDDDTSSLIHSPIMISSTSSTSSSSSSSIKSPTPFHYRHSSFNMSRSYSSKYQPQLKQSTSNPKHIDRLSKQYTDVNLINQILATNPSSHLITSTSELLIL